MRKPRVLLLSEGFGTGHTQAAHALAHGIKKVSPQVHSRVIELGKFLNPTVAPLIFSAYRKTLSVQPKLVSLLYRTQYNKSLNGLTKLALHRIFYTQTAQVVSQLKPDIVICTHPFPNAVISRLKRQGLNTPLYTLITDYDVHGTWINPEVNKYLASTPQVKALLEIRGVPASQIQITGIPVHPDFWEAGDKVKLREEMGLQNMPTALLMGGGWGLSFDEEDMKALASWADRVQLIFCLGSNQKMIDKMKEIPCFQHPNIRILGYTKEVSKLMDVSDVLITKPGGMTCTEAMAKGLPMLFIPPHPGQEEENCEYFVQAGYGQIIHSADVITDRFRELSELELQSNQPNRPEHTKAKSGHSLPYDPACCAQAVHDLLFPATTEVTTTSLERFSAGITNRPLSGTRLPLRRL
ncbi:MGDG synthase family glycosyltransferase [Paenibacillus amylolyticus]|uniref:MGDG synthase family glycosyltransferase n=1 Tax=Paenibacillus amylolyticus TaxID=1451 RepID=UPI003EBD2806